MAADGVSVDVGGFEQLAQRLREIAPAMRKRVLRNALAAGGRLVRDEARRHPPVLRAAVPYRTAGLVRKSIVVRTSKIARRAGDVGVFINVRPAKAGLRGARSKSDPYYWRWLEFGTVKMRATPFLKPAASRLQGAVPIISAAVGRWIDKINASGRVVP